MAESQDYFFDLCGSLFERMINTVPKTVTLSEIIEPIPLKPRELKVSFGPQGLTATGYIRVRPKIRMSIRYESGTVNLLTK
jgi:hypothetical protein